MKKFFEKHDLFKLTGIVLIIAVILSWVVSASYYQNGVLSTDGINRAGIFDITTYGMLSVYYFTVIFVFAFIVAGFYKFLSNIEAYDKLTDKIASAITGKEKIFVALSTFTIAALAGVSTEYFALFAIIPFVIAILAKLKVDKITGLVSTFGGVLIGILGCTYSTKIVGKLVEESAGLGVNYGFELLGAVIIFVVAYLLMMFFVFSRMSKVKKDSSKYELLVDPFYTEKAEEKKTKGKKVVRKVSVAPMAIILFITLVVMAIAYIGWQPAFGINVFENFHKWITEATLFDNAVYSYILGQSLTSIGSWDLVVGCGFLLIMTLLIKIAYRVPFDTVLDSYSEGFKKVGNSVVILLTVFLVLEISVIFPTVPAIVDKIMKLGTNVGTLFVSGFLTSIFTVDFQYTVGLVGSLFKTFSDASVAALVLQASYGVAAFIAPTSIMLMFGLSFLDIKFKDYFKFIWKFMLALIVVVLIVLAILMYV